MIERRVFDGMSFDAIAAAEKPRLGRDHVRKIIYAGFAEIRESLASR